MAAIKPLSDVQEAFAQLLAQGRKGGYRDLQEAEKNAGVKVSDRNNAAVKANRYSRSPRVLLRVQEIANPIEKPEEITQDIVVDMLYVAYESAKTVKHPSAMVQAAVGLAKVLGFMAPEKVQVINPAEAVEKGRQRAEAGLKKASVVKLIQPQK